jgi:DNA-binding NtrC family response regulator
VSGIGWQHLLAAGERGGQILIVDDEAAVRSSLRRLVSGLGYSVLVASSAEEAQACMRAQSFDVLILDLQLPGMSGEDFMEWALERDPELAVVVVTGSDDAATAVRCLDGGARSHLVKPVEDDFLRLAIRDALAVRHLLAERNRLAARDPE